MADADGAESSQEAKTAESSGKPSVLEVYQPDFVSIQVEGQEVKLDLKACASQAAAFAALSSVRSAGADEPILTLESFPGGPDMLKDIVRYMQANAAEERATLAATGQLGVPAGILKAFSWDKWTWTSMVSWASAARPAQPNCVRPIDAERYKHIQMPVQQVNTGGVLRDFMTTYGKTGLPPPDLPVSAAKTDTATDGSDPQNCRLGARKAALSGEGSSSSSEEGDDLGDSDELDELPQHAAPLGRAARAVVLAPLALENEDDEENELAEDPEPRKRPRLSKKPSRGCTGLRGVSRRLDTKTRRKSYQASVRFENLSFRSKYSGDIQMALDHHITLMRIRSEELVRVMTAKRTNVYKLRRRPSVEKAQRFAEKIWEEACERKRRSKREALHVRQRERQQRRRLALWQRWQKAAPRAERQLAREQQVQEKILQNHLARELKAMRAEDAVQQKLRSAHRKVELGHRWQRRRLSSERHLRHLTFAQQQALGAELRWKQRSGGEHRGAASSGATMSNGAKSAVDMIAGMEKQERILVIDFGSQAWVRAEPARASHICKEMCHFLGGKVEPGVKREFGHAELLIREDVAHLSADGTKKIKGRSPIFEGISTERVPVWMSHGDKVTQIPSGFTSIAYTSNTEYAAIEDQTRHFYGVQFHPEVTHTPSGATMIKNFVLKVVGCKGEWNMHDFCQKQIDRALADPNRTARMLCGGPHNERRPLLGQGGGEVSV
eukprot:g12203.t1